jgi:GntR family transcriptional regulator
MRGIAAGLFPLGSLLPPEAALCERFGVSRATVREALRQLSEMGIVNTSHGIGTRVEAIEAHGNYVLSVESMSDLMQYGAQTLLQVLDKHAIAASMEDALRLGCAPGDRWIRLRALRMLSRDEKHPISFSEILIDERFADVASETSPTVSFYKLIGERHGEQVASLDQEISAVDIAPDVAMKLGVEPGSSGLQVIRRFVGRDGRPFEITINTHPKNRFSYRLHLNRALPK